MSKVGVQYFEDNLHFKTSDVNHWKGSFQSLVIKWIVLPSQVDIAIPEPFIQNFLDNGVNPVIHLKVSPNQIKESNKILWLLNLYKKWGVKHVILSDSPNQKANWETSSWLNSDPAVEFINIITPIIQHLQANDILPILPPLYPGGDYWDTAFLKRMLETIREQAVVDFANLGISCYPYVGEKPLDWGKGGKETWPNAKAYAKDARNQNHIGFRIFEWYNTMAEMSCSMKLPLALLDIQVSKKHPQTQEYIYAKIYQHLVSPRKGSDSLPENILFGAIPIQILDTLLSKVNALPVSKRPILKKSPPDKLQNQSKPTDTNMVIEHYLLLPTYEWGIADWHIDVIKPFIRKYQPTIGFSIMEASYAKRVTVLGGEQLFPEEILNELRTAGCIVHRIDGDGMEIASKLAKL